ncbi:Vacuolar protein sorting-associated protein 8 [Haplosporangium bisporale]|nr:Vacuolar protein sorting-associated protein 8 [Haplosporangium bisporale]
MSSTTGGTAAASTKDEYDALLKEILESDSSEDERYRTLILSSRNHRATSPVLGFDPDTDLADIHPVSIASFSKSSVPLSPPTPTTRTKAVAPHANISSPPISITIGAGTPGTPGSPHRTQNPHLLSTSPPKDNNSSLLLPLSSPSSVASSPSSSLNTLTRASSIGSSSVKSGYNQPYNSIHFLASRLTEEPFPVSSAIDVEVALEYPTLASNYLSNLKSFKQRERAAQASTVAKKIENHHQSFIQRHEQRLSRYNQRTEALQRNSSAMESNRKSRENGHRNGRDSSSTIPIVLKGSNGRLVNGLQSITSLEQKFNELRIQELDLLNTPESTIKAVLADIYKISEELHMHLQGGPLSDAPRQGRKEGDGIIISGESQRQKRIKDILDRIVRETSLYEEFVRKSTYLSLDAILNEASDEDEELQGFGNLGRDMSDIDSTSDVHREDTLSQTSLMSGNHYGHTNSPSLPNSPLSSLSFRSIEPNHRLRPHPLSHGGPGSVASSSAITGRHSRASSVSFSVTGITPSETHSPDPGVGAEPWETFRWTPLLKLSDQLFSDEIKASSGLGTCIAVSNIIAIGTSRGSVLVYSTTQTLIGIYGNPQYALEHGSVCSISISSDHSYMVAGHSLGSIIVWNINKPNAPSRIIPPVTKETALSGRKIGHIRGSAVLSVAFVGIKRAEVVSADDQLLIVCVKPQPQTLFKFLRPKDPQSREGETNVALSGNLAWFPTTKSQRGPIGKAAGAANGSGSGAHLSSERKPVEANGKSPRLEFVNVGDWICREGIVGIQWVRPQILLLLTNTEDIIVFDPKAMCETERCSARSLQIVYHDWFKDVVRSHVAAAAANIPLDTKRVTADMCYNSSWKVHKGKLFVLGVRRVQVGTILNWTDRILALVKSGDFLEGIALATLFYTGKSVQAAVVGLPEDEASRKQVVGEKIYELLTASLNYTFNPERMMDVDADAAAGGVGAGTVLFHDLAIQAIESCLAIEDQAFLFEDVYERYGEASINVRGIFLQSMEGYILQDRLTEMPPQVMQAFVNRDFSQMSRNGQEGPGRVMSRQLIINTLLEVLTPSVSFSSNSISDMSGNSSNDTEDEYTARDIAHLYSFVARAYARSPKSLVLSPTTLHRILTRLSSDTDLTTREERQIAVQALLRCYTPSDESGMMDLYEQAGFYRVLEKMHRSQKQFGPMIITFLRDPERRPLVFEAIRKLLDPTRPQRTPITEKQRTDIVKTAMEHIAEIVDIDGEQAALLVHKYLNAEHRSVLETLHGSKPRLFAYLRGLLEPSNKAPEKRQLITEREAAGGLSVYMDNTELSPTGGSSITDPEIHEQYVELLCQYDPSGVYDYLERHQDNSYRLERVLKTCENAGVVDAVVWILERSGNVGGALGKVLDIVQERIDMLSTLVKSKSDGKIQDAYWTLEEQSNTRDSLVRLRGVLNVGKQLCERRSQKAKLLSQVSTAPLPQASTNNESDTETLWFRLLQAFVAASRKMTFLIASGKGGSADQVEGDLSTQRSNANKAVLIENAPPALFSNSSPESQYSYNVTDQLSNNFKGFVQSILATLLLSTSTPQVSLPSLLRRLLRSESSGDGDLNRFSDFKDIFLGMLDTFKYEGQLLEMTNGLFERDLFMGVQLIAKTRARGWRPRKGNCEICGGAFWGPNIVRELWVQQQKAAASAIKAALSTNVNGTTPEPSSENASSPESRTETPDIKATVPENKDKDKEKNGSDKDLLLFRCGHGYHRQCLEMESSALLATSGQRLSTSETLDFDAAKTLNCAVCNGLVTVRKSRSTSSHRNSPSHRAGRSSRTSKSNNWVHLDTPQPTSSPRRTPRIVVSPSPPTVPGTAGRSLNNRSNGSSEGYGHPVENGDSISRPQTPVNRTQFSQDEHYPTSYNSSSYESPGPGGYQNSNEYEAATSPSMRASHNSKGKQKAAY